MAEQELARAKILSFPVYQCYFGSPDRMSCEGVGVGADNFGKLLDDPTAHVLSEVKNVGSLSYTQQLRDFAQFAAQTGRRFDLYVRPGAQLSGPLLNAEARGLVNILEIPF